MNQSPLLIIKQFEYNISSVIAIFATNPRVKLFDKDTFGFGAFRTTIITLAFVTSIAVPPLY